MNKIGHSTLYTLLYFASRGEKRFPSNEQIQDVIDNWISRIAVKSNNLSPEDSLSKSDIERFFLTGLNPGQIKTFFKLAVERSIILEEPWRSDALGDYEVKVRYRLSDEILKANGFEASD